MFKLASTAHDKPRPESKLAQYPATMRSISTGLAEQASAATMNSISSTGSAEQASAAHKRKQPPASSTEQASAAASAAVSPTRRASAASRPRSNHCLGKMVAQRTTSSAGYTDA